MKPATKRRAGGYYTKIARVKGKIAKFFPERVSPKEARQLEKLHKQYIELLERAGINVAKTEMATRRMDENRTKIRLVQEPFTPDEIVSNRLRRCAREEALGIAKKIFEQTAKVLEFNRTVAIPQYGLVVGADFKPDNMAIRNGMLVYIDTFSPHLRDAKDPTKIHAVFERYFKRQGKMLNWITRGYLTETVYNPRLRFITLLGILSRTRPELRKDFFQSARETIKAKLPKEEASKILPGLTMGRIAASRMVATGVRWLGNRKGKNIQV